MCGVQLLLFFIFFLLGKKLIKESSRAALTTHELELLEPWGKLAELELKCSNRELVYVENTNVTQTT